MKCSFLLFLALFSLISCKKEHKLPAEDWEIISENVRLKDNGTSVLLKSGKFNYTIPAEKLPYQKVMLLNASLVGYFTSLALENKITGISSPEYVFSTKIHRLLDEGKIQNIGNEQKYDIEKIIALKPDVIFTNYVAAFSNTYDLIRKNGIEVIFLDEYLEQDPLEKSKYLRIFGRLLGADRESSRRISEIENSYDSLKKLAQKSHRQPIVLANEMYGNQWFLPGGKTGFSQFIKDANAIYINTENSDTKAVPLSFEEVYAKAQNAEYWVNVGNHKEKKELLQINPNYAKMHVYQNGKLYNVSGKERGKANDYFESGIVRADLVLKDYIRIFHPELLPNYQLTYLKAIK